MIGEIRTMCRISPISDDWVVKGFHIHILGVELAMRPDHRGGIVFKKVFRSTDDRIAEVAAKAAKELLTDTRWRNRFRETTRKALEYMREVRGDLETLAIDRSAELRFLAAALDRLET